MNQRPPSEPITLIGLDEARARGEQAQSAEDHQNHPHAVEIALQGSQAETTAAKSQVDAVVKAVAALQTARARREQFDPLYLRAAGCWAEAETEVGRAEDEIDEKRRSLPLLPFGSGVVFLILLVIAAAEFVLNRAAFQITGEESVNVDVLAVAVGVGLVTGGHFLGIALRRLVDRLPGTPLSPVALLVAAVGGALFIAIIAINTLREAFFTESEIPVPDGSLAWLQVFLLWVAVALSAAHANPLRENLVRVRSLATAKRKAFEKTRSEWVALFDKHAETHARTWAAVAAAAADGDIQLAHTERARQAFAQGAKTSLPPADVTPTRIIKSWDEWLDRTPMELTTPAVVGKVERVLAGLGEDATSCDEVERPNETVDVSDTDRELHLLSDLETAFSKAEVGP